MLNNKIHTIRIKKGMSLAEVAFKTGYTINDIKNFETVGTIISGYALLRIINTFDMSIEEFRDFK